jgi:RNA polymerase sigma factor (sigma-70 family)
MTRVGAERILRHVRQTLTGDGRHVQTDGALLDRYVRSNDGDAFAALVDRHGPMVFGVCRRTLGDVHEAEDAFQATFLVLARRAAVVVPREAVGSWLHGVARRTALRARANRGRRAAREKRVEDLPCLAASPPESSTELRGVLDRALERLPEKYRLPVILCELEGRPRREVAAQLQVAEGTLSSRLATARKLLARRLGHRGLALSGSTIVAGITGSEAVALSPRVTTAARQIGIANLREPRELPVRVLQLAKEVGKSMFLAKLKKIGLAAIATAALLAVVTRGNLRAFTEPPSEKPTSSSSPQPIPAAPIVSRAGEKTQLQIDVVVYEGDPLGSREDGKVRMLAMPRLVTNEGSPADFFMGAEKRLSIPGVEKLPAEYVPEGLQFNIIARHLHGRLYLMDLTVSKTIPVSHAKDFVKLHTTSTRLLQTVEAGVTLRLRCSSTADDKDVWAEFTVRELK